MNLRIALLLALAAGIAAETSPPARTWADEEAPLAGDEAAIHRNAPLVFPVAGSLGSP